MKKIFVRVLAFCLSVSFILGNVNLSASNVYAASGFSFNWNKDYILDQTLNQVARGDKKDSVLLWWEFGVNGGVNFDLGKYDLTYNLEDNKQITFTIDKQGNNLGIDYKVYDFNKGAYIAVSDTLYQVYKSTTGDYVKPTASSYPAISEGYEVVYNTEGNPDDARFNIMPNQGFSFKFDNRTITFYWSRSGNRDTFLYTTDGAMQGSVYEFDLNLTISDTVVSSDSLQIFTGINTATFTSTPLADGKTIAEALDHTGRPISEAEYTSYETQLELAFDKPKYWDDTQKKFLFKDSDPTSIVFDLGNIDVAKKLQVIIEDIYASDINAVTSIASESGVTVKSSVDAANSDRIKVLLSNLEPGTIFNPVEISLSKPGDLSFLADFSTIDHGKVYTFPRFFITSMGVYEYYMEIEPFKGYNGYYLVQIGAAQTTMTRWAEYEEKNLGKANIFIPVNLSALNPQTQFFKFDFIFTPPDSTVGSVQQTLQSQTIKYRTSEDDIIIGAPQNLTVIKSLVTTDTETDAAGNFKESLYLTLKWDVAFEDVMRNILTRNGGELSVTYNFNRSETPSGEDLRFTQIPIHYLLDGENVIVDADKIDAEVAANPILYEFFHDVASYEVMVGTQKKNHIQHQVTLKLDVASKTSDSATFFQYPNIYFVNINGTYTDMYQRTTTSSLPVSITVDSVVTVDVTPPQNLKLISTQLTEDKANAEFSVQWDAISINSLAEYIDVMLDKKGLTFSESESVRFDAYISTNKDSLKKIDDETLVKAYEIESSQNNNLAFDMLSAPLYSSDEDYISPTQWLYNNTAGEPTIVKIQNIYQGLYSETIRLQLDRATKNQDYYMVVYAYIVPVESFSDEDYAPEYSAASNIITVTTPDDIKVPETDDREPEAPTGFSVVEVDMDTAKIKWDKGTYSVNYDDPESYGIEYEIIRLKSKRLEDIEFADEKLTKDTKESFAYCFNLLKNNAKTEVVGIKADEAGENVYKWNDSSFAQVTGSELFYEVIDNENAYHLTDRLLGTNELYFYYIRTVKYDAKDNRLYSVWIPLTLTTSPVGALKNLKVERSASVITKYQTASGRTLNEKTQALISFDAPLFDDTKTDIFEFRYSLKPDGGSWTEDKTLQVNAYFDKTDVDPSGYVKYYYLISGLTQGTTYNLRVRFYDKTVDDMSSYSNIVQIRTEIDQPTWDSDEIVDDWLDYYKKELEKIGKDPYWLTQDQTGKMEAIYRPNHFSGVMGGTTTSLVKLVEGGVNKGETKTYYLSQDTIEKAYDAGKGFSISYENADLILSPRSIYPSENDAILEIRQDIKDREIEDYCLKVTVAFDTFKGGIYGNEGLSPAADVSITAIGANENIADWDARMQQLLTKRINDPANLRSVFTEIKSEEKSQTSSEEMVRIIKELVEEFKEDFFDEVADEFDDILENKETMYILQGNIYYAYPADNTVSVVGYEKSSGSWASMEAIDYNGKKAVYSNAVTAFVLTGRKINLPGLTGTENAAAITALFAKYGLSDYFGTGNSFNMEAPVTRKMALGSACRFMGAGTNFDMVQFMASKGITVSARNMDEPVQMQEAVYYTMLAYETRTNTKIETITIRNYALTANAAGFLPKYKKSVQAAVEMGVYTNPIIEPSGNMKVKDFLQVLVNLANRANLL